MRNKNCLVEFALFVAMMYNEGDLTSKFNNICDIVTIMLFAKKEHLGEDEYSYKFVAKEEEDIFNFLKVIEEELIKKRLRY